MEATQIRTYPAQRGRMGTGRRVALERLRPVYGVSVTGGLLNPEELFGRVAPLALEIGSGMGEATAAMAAADPDRDYIAAEVHSPGVANLLRLIDSAGLTNVRVCHGDALELLRQRVAPGSLDGVYAFFPDPWPKRRHHKRRLFQPAHIALLRSSLALGGLLLVATDSPEYARSIQQTLVADPELVEGQGDHASAHRPPTRYEKRARTAGRLISELAFRRASPG